MIGKLKKIKNISVNFCYRCSDSLKNANIGSKISTKIKDTSNYITQKTEKSGQQALNSLKKSQQFVKNNFQQINATISDFCQPLSRTNLSNNNKIIWLCFTLFLWFVLHCTYSYIEYLKNISVFNIIGILLAIVSLILIGILFYILCNDFLGIITVSKQIKSKEHIRKLIQTNNIAELKNYLLSNKVIENSRKQLLSENFAHINNLTDLLSTYEEIELKEADKKVNSIINKYALIASTAAVKDGFFNFVIMCIVFSKMLIDIAKTYKIKLGICSFINVMLMGLIGSSISSVLSKVIGATFKQIPYINAIVEIGTPIAIMRVLGCKVKYAIRPLEPFNQKMLKSTIKEMNKDGENDE